MLMTNLGLDPKGNQVIKKGWVNHPATQMWKGCEMYLYEYILVMVAEWKRRGFKSTIGDKATATMLAAYNQQILTDETTRPAWMQDSNIFDAITKTHRQALLAKNYDWYKQFGWEEDTGEAPQGYEYLWVKSVIEPLSANGNNLQAIG